MSLFTQIVECYLDAFVIEGLKVAAKLVAATGGAIEKLAYPANRGVRLTVAGGRCSQCRSCHRARRWLLADAQHLRAIAHRGDMLIAPPDLSSSRRQATAAPLVSRWTPSVYATMFRWFSEHGIFTPAD